MSKVWLSLLDRGVVNTILAITWNILYAAITAKAKGLKVIGLTGANDSELSKIADVTIRSSQTRTYMIQEHHLPIYHCLCLMLEERFFGEE